MHWLCSVLRVKKNILKNVLSKELLVLYIYMEIVVIDVVNKMESSDLKNQYLNTTIYSLESHVIENIEITPYFVFGN